MHDDLETTEEQNATISGPEQMQNSRKFSYFFMITSVLVLVGVNAHVKDWELEQRIYFSAILFCIGLVTFLVSFSENLTVAAASLTRLLLILVTLVFAGFLVWVVAMLIYYYVF